VNARDVLWTSWHNVWRRRIRTILAAAGVAVGILVLVTLLSLGVGLRREVTQQISTVGLEWVEVRPGGNTLSFLGAGDRTPTHPLTSDVVAEWETRPDVVELRTTIYLPGMEFTSLVYGDEVLQVSLYESTLSFEDPFQPETQFIAGRDLRPGREGEVVLGQDVILNLEANPETFIDEVITITLSAPRGDTITFPFTVVGVTDAPFREVRIGAKDRQKMKEWWFNETDLLETRGYDTVALRTQSVVEAQKLAEELSEAGYNVRTSKTIFDMMQRGILIFEAMLSSIAVLALFVAGIGIANTMVMAIYERTREIGLLKALGASRREIRLIFVSEAAFIGLLGGVTGLILGWLVSLGLNQLVLLFFRWQEVPIRGTFFVTTLGLALLALAFGTVVGALSGLLPAGRASKLDPVQALRYE
jgi:ABC-type antimicrobial peptide transport system permease subunit